MDQEIAAVRYYLSLKYFHVSDEWLEGCVNFFRSENSGGYGRAQLEEFVLEQWKLADLREMGKTCLPQNLAANMKVMLPGKYSLQVESMLDIAAPCYSQLQKIRRMATENLDVSEIKPQTWEPRPTRMFKLMLCDGVQEIMGIEYRPIRKLDQTLVPGCKVLVVGPVECRRGVVLLQEHNLQIIGGEVDSLLIENALENLLARNLLLEENPQPNINGLTPPENVSPAQVNVQTNTVNNSVPPATLTSIQPTALNTTMHHPAINKSMQPTAVTTSLQSNRPVAQVAPMATNNFGDDDIQQYAELNDIEKRFQQEMDDIPDDMIIDDEVSFSGIVSKGWNVGCNKAATSGRTVNAVLPPTPDRGCDARELRQLNRNNCDAAISKRVQSVKKNDIILQVVTNKLNTKENYLNGQNPYLSDVNKSLIKFKTDSLSDLDDFEVNDFNYSQYSSKNSTTAVNSSVHEIDLLEQDDELLLDISSQDLDATVLPTQEESLQTRESKSVFNNRLPTKKGSVNICKKPIQQNQSKITSFISNSQIEKNSFSGPKERKKPIVAPTALKRPPSSPLKKTSAPLQKNFLEQKKYKPLDEIATSSHNLATKQDKTSDAASNFFNKQTPSKLHNEMDSGVKDYVTSRGTEISACHSVCNASSSNVVLSVMEHKPFVYLSQLQSLPRTRVATFTVKAFILTIVSQLVLKKMGWHLLCKINDGSMVVQVDFSSEVLEKLIGYTPAEMRVLRQQMTTNPAIKEKVMRSLFDAQKKLVNLNCFLDLTISPHTDVPMVTAISEVNREHIELLNRRLQVLTSSVLL